MQNGNIVSLDVDWASLLLLLMRAWIVFLEVIPFDSLLKDLDDLLSRILFVFRRFWPWLESLVVDLLVDLRQVLMLASGDADHLLVSILARLVSEKDVDCAIFEDHDELVRVSSLNHWLKPSDMDDLATLLHFLSLVILDHHTFVLELGVVAADSTCLRSQEQLNLWLVPALDFILTLRYLRILYILRLGRLDARIAASRIVNCSQV